MGRKSRDRPVNRLFKAAVVLAALLALSGCKVEVDHFFEADGSSVFQMGIGEEIDPEEGESIDCDDTEAAEGFEIAYADLSQRGSETWCTVGVALDSPLGLAAVYATFNEDGEFVRVNCLSVEDGHLVYDIELLVDNEGVEEGDGLLWRVTAPGEILNTNADSVSGSTATWDLVRRSDWVSLEVNTEGTDCPTAGFSLDLVADSATMGTAYITAEKPATGEADGAALVAALTGAGWQVAESGDVIEASRVWEDAAALQAIAGAIPPLEGSDLTVAQNDAGGSDFEAHLDLSFYEAFWQGINPEIGDPPFRFSWTPSTGNTESSGDWTDADAHTFSWTVDDAGRIFNMSTTATAAEPGDTAGGAGDGSDGDGDEESTAGDAGDDAGGEAGDEEAGGGDASGDDGGLDPLVLVGGVAVVGGAGALEVRRRKRKGPRPDGEQADPPEEEEEREPSTVSLELTYPAGHSPFVFQFGWVFGARCLVDGPSGQRDLSDRVRWSGSDGAEFHPPVGRISHPSFKRGGREMLRGEKAHGTITLAVDVDGEMTEKTFTVGIVSIHGFARVSDLAKCPADAHGCPACPHPTVGPIATGSPTVTVDGLPAARVGDTGVHAACCGPNMYTIASGDPSVLIDGRPAAMVGSRTDHCGGTGSIETSYGGG